MREFFPCPDCNEDVDLYGLEESEENDFICECGCEFTAEADDDGDVTVTCVFAHGRKTEEEIGRVQALKYLDPATPSLFPDIPPLRELINAG